MLQELRRSGVDVIYSSELVPPDLGAPPARAASRSLQRASDALAANGLTLRPLAPNKYVVVRSATPCRRSADSDEPMDEVSVYASRYAIDAGLAEPRELSATDIERVPGSHDDALRALHSLPGIASNASARPYIRGSLSEDVLVRYDGIPLLDPFHLKNFQSLISAIDPAGIEQHRGVQRRISRAVRHAVRRSHRRRGAVAAIGARIPRKRQPDFRRRVVDRQAERWPVEWLGAIRRSTLDLLDPVEDGFGTPEFSDTLGRLRWVTEQGAWTAGLAAARRPSRARLGR